MSLGLSLCLLVFKSFAALNKNHSVHTEWKAHMHTSTWLQDSVLKLEETHINAHSVQMALVFSVGSEIFWRYCENHLRSWYRFCKVLFITTGKASHDHNTGAVAKMNLELSLDFESKQER